MTNPLESFSTALSENIAEVSRSIVLIQGRHSSSTGIHWRQGLIVTSCEAINPSDSLHLVLPSGQTGQTEILGSDTTTDIAILSLPDGIELPTAPLGDSQSLALGQLVSTVGQSALNSTLNSDRGGDRTRGRGRGGRGRRSSVNQGVDQADRSAEQAAAPSDENTQQPTATFASVGIVSQISGPWRSQSGGQLDQRIAVSLNLRRGSAGCPLINASGQVVGFNTFGPRRSVLTIPATTVNRVVDQLQQRGKISRGYLGLGMQMVALPENVQQQHELTQPAGIMVISVESDSAADQAGMVLGDMMIAIDDMPLESLRQMQALLNPQSVGQTMSVRLLRGGQMQTVAVTVGER